jgi:hypothetical protein
MSSRTSRPSSGWASRARATTAVGVEVGQAVVIRRAVLAQAVFLLH